MTSCCTVCGATREEIDDSFIPAYECLGRAGRLLRLKAIGEDLQRRQTKHQDA